MYDASYYAAMGVDDPVSFANSASPYMDSGLTGEMEGAFGGSGYDSAMAGMMGGMGGGFSALQGLAKQTNPQAGVGGGLRRSLSKRAIPGVFQMLPTRDLSQKPDNPDAVAVRGREGGIPRPTTEPAGMTQPAGNPMDSNYSNLNGLKNRAYGVSYGTV